MGAAGRQIYSIQTQSGGWHAAAHQLLTYRKASIMSKEITRGDIYFANLNPVLGSEQGGLRPVLVIQNDIGNKNSTTVIIAPITGKTKPHIPTHVLLDDVAELRPDSIVLLEQLRTIDVLRFGKKIGSLSSLIMEEIDEALQISLGLKTAEANPMILTLCPKCVQAYYDTESYFIHRRTYDQEIKEPCTMCNVGLGYDYEVTRR